MKVEGKRTIDDQEKVTRRLVLSANTDYILNQCAVIHGITRGQVVDIAIVAYAVAHNVVVTMRRDGPPPENPL